MQDKLTEKIAERIITLSGEKGMGRDVLARALEITTATVSRYFGAQRAPTLEMLVRVADLFEVTTDYLLGLEDESSRHAFTVRPPFDKRLTWLIARMGTTAYRLSQATLINEDTIRAWLRGESEPRASSVVRLAKFFHAPADFIIGRA